MKKIYTLVAAAFICSSASAQAVDSVNFESHDLSPESFDNGFAGLGDFNFGLVSFSNYYDVAWGSWNGFSISNMTDNTTAGWGNQYSAFPGSGRNSSNYGVYYPEGVIQSSSNAIIDSFYISNSTFAGISMRDGDAFGKQFGSIYAADGTTVDGTNGEDFFKVWVIAEDFFGAPKDSLEVFLADYRFVDNLQDYIVDSWIKVDVSSLGLACNKLSFRFESSDIGAFGINTPTYFVLDDAYYSLWMGVDEVNPITIDVFPNPVNDIVSIKGENGTITLKDVNGIQILSQEHFGITTLNVNNLASGIYFIELISPNGKAISKIVK